MKKYGISNALCAENDVLFEESENLTVTVVMMSVLVGDSVISKNLIFYCCFIE
jgi:hypothetical protein